MAKRIQVGGRIESNEVGGIVTGAAEILDDAKGKKQSIINGETDDELLRLDQSKQDNLTFDNAPTEGSNNPVKSGGVYAADKALSDAIEAILLLIPSAASGLNKLVDTAMMNSSISTATATFKGTYNVVTDLSLTIDATHEQIAAALGNVISSADNNDYAFVQVPVSAESTDIRRTERYKFNGTAWGYEYDLNTSGFTAAQWAAINSGITLALVGKLIGLPTSSELQALLGQKQDTLAFDNIPVSGSANPVKSGGVYSAINDEKTAREQLAQTVTGINERLGDVEEVIPTGAAANNKLVANNSMEAYVTSIIEAITASFTIATADGHINLTLTQTNGRVASLTLTSSDIASAQALTALTGRVSTAESDITTINSNITSLGGRVSTNETDIANLQQLYNDLQQSKPVPVTALPSTGQQQGVIYRLAGTTSYSDYMWNGSTWVLMATYNNAIEPRPKKASQNLVTSGGVFNEVYFSSTKNISLDTSDASLFIANTAFNSNFDEIENANVYTSRPQECRKYDVFKFIHILEGNNRPRIVFYDSNNVKLGGIQVDSDVNYTVNYTNAAFFRFSIIPGYVSSVTQVCHKSVKDAILETEEKTFFYNIEQLDISQISFTPNKAIDSSYNIIDNPGIDLSDYISVKSNDSFKQVYHDFISTVRVAFYDSSKNNIGGVSISSDVWVQLNNYPTIAYLRFIWMTGYMDEFYIKRVYTPERCYYELHDDIVSSSKKVKGEKYLYRLDINDLSDITLNDWVINSINNCVTNNGNYGFNKQLIIEKQFSIDTRTILFDFSISQGGVAYFGTAENKYGNRELIGVDLGNSKLDLYQFTSQQPDTPFMSANIVSGSYYGKKLRLTISREGRSIKIKLIDLSSYGQISQITVESWVTSRVFFWGRPCAYSTVADINIYNIIVNCVKSPSLKTQIYVVGDSITEGEGIQNETDRWTNMLSQNFPENTLIVSGRSGATIDQVLPRMYSEADVLNPNYIMVTIGTNGGLTKDKVLDLINSINNLGAIPIINHIPYLTDATQTNSTNAVIDEAIEESSIRCLCTKFDIATSVDYLGIEQDGSLFFDGVHPNATGCTRMYNRIKIDCPEIFDEF